MLQNTGIGTAVAMIDVMLWCRGPWRGILSGVEIGPLEERVLELLWRTGERSVHDVREDLGARLAYTTVMTTLDRLYKKGLLARRRSGRAYRYAPRMSREALAAGTLRGWLERLLPRAPARPLLACFVDTVGEHDRELLAELERLVREKERAMKQAAKP